MTCTTRVCTGHATRSLLMFVSALLLAVVARATIGASLQMQLGNPSSATTDPTNHNHYLMQRDQYALDYNDVTREPNWVSWDLTTDDVGSSGRSSFIQDTTLPSGFYQVLTTDYSGSGYDRGHMCPSADRTVTVADNQQVFYMSNMVPQSPDNNQGVWANFENYCRSLASAGNELLITCGPSGFGGSTIASGVAIPGYTWKIAVVVPLGTGNAVSRVTSSTRVIAIKVPNIAGVRSTPWQNFVTSVAQIESDTGYTFFSALPASVANALKVVVDGQSAVGAPSIVVQPANQTTVVGGTATFAVTANGDAPLAYQWLKDDVEIPGATSASLTLGNVQAADVGNYDVVISNAVGSATSNAASLIVTGLPPAITTSPAGETVAAGSTVTLAVTASGSPTLFYQWRQDSTALTGATNATLTLTNVQAADAGNYDVVVTNPVGTATSGAAALVVTPAAPTIAKQPAAQTATIGGSATFAVTAIGTAPLSYQWRKAGAPLTDGGNVAGAATTTLTLSNVAAVDAANYDVVVSNSLGSTASAPATLTVTAPPPATINWNFGTSTGVATPTSGLPSDITGGTIIQGNNNGTTPLLSTTSASSGYTGSSGTFNAGAAARIGPLNQGANGSAYFEFTLTPISGKRLTVSGISFGSRSTNTGPAAFSIFSSVDNFTTAVASGTLTVTSNPWLLYTPAVTTVTGATSTPVTFRMYGYNGAGSPQTGTANWRIDDLKVAAATVFPPPVAPVVTATSPANGATNVDVATPITVTFNEAVSFTGTWFSITSAANGTTAAAVTGGPTTYTITPPSNFAYSDTIGVTIIGAQVVDQATGTIHGTGNTSFSFTTGVYVPPTPPSVTTQPTAQSVNVGGTATFTMAAAGTAPLIYQWRHNAVPISGNASASTAALTLAGVALADAGSYDCVVSNVAGSDISHAATLTVTVVPPTITSSPVSQMPAYGGIASFTVAASGTAPFTYQWRQNGAPLANGGVVSGANTATLTLTGVTTADNASYDVAVTNAAGSATSSPALLEVSQAAGVIYWDFAAATPTSGIPAGITGGEFSQGNNNGTTVLLSTTSASGSYTGASGGNNAGAAARVGSFSATTSAYFEFTFTPAAGRQLAASALTFGMRSTGTGPQTFAIFSSVDNFTTPLASGPVPNDSAWHAYAPTFGGVVGGAGAPVTFRLFGYNGTGSPATNIANWRIDDVKLTAGLLTLPPTVPVLVGTTPAVSAVDVPVASPITLTFDQPVNVTGNWITVFGSVSGAIPTAVSGGPTTFTLTPAGSFAYAETVTVTIVAAQVKEQATNTVPMAANASFTFATPTPPVVTSPPHTQTATVGDTLTFTVAATGSAPLSYQWRKQGVALAGATDSSLTLANITTAAAGDYDVVIANVAGAATSASATLTVNKAIAVVQLSDLTRVYNGVPQGVTVATVPAGFSVDVSYNGSPVAPTDAGSYAVVATINDPNYAGSASATLVIAAAHATVTLTNLTQTYTGMPKVVTATTAPANLPVTITYDGSTSAPVNAGSYAVSATITDPNYVGSTTGSLQIAKATPVITWLAPAAITYGTALGASQLNATASTAGTFAYTPPTGTVLNAGASQPLSVSFTPADSADFTSATTATTITVNKATAPITLANLSQSYDGTPKSATAATVPTGLTVNVTYNGSASPPTNPGAYAVVATVDDPNYAGTASGTLVIRIAALVRHAPSLSGGLDGSLQVASGENLTLGGSAWVSGDLLLPGLPTVQSNGHPTFGGVVDGSGALTPADYAVTLGGNAVLRHLVRRTDALALPTVAAPPAPAGTRNVVLTSATQNPGDFATLRDLTLNGNAGAVAVPAGTYGNITVNSGNRLVLGVVGATEPALYNLQTLTVNGSGGVQIVGPIVVALANGTALSGAVGSADHPEWLTLLVASGGTTLNGGATFAGSIVAPAGTVAINGNATLDGSVICDRLTISGDGVLQSR